MDESLPMDEAAAWSKRIEELEIQAAFQEDMVQQLNDCVARLQHTVDLQQAELRWLYQRLLDRNANADGEVAYNAANEIPPHY